MTAPLSPVALELATFFDPESEVTPDERLVVAHQEGLNPDVATGAVDQPAPVADSGNWHPSDAAVYGRNAGGAS